MRKTKIIVSSRSGFCFGVQRALNIAKGALKKGKTVYSLGPIIHNPQVVRDFSKKGLKVISDIRKVNSKGVAVLIPSHGISPDVLRKKRIACIDTTCPLVGRVQKIVQDFKRKGYFVIIAGDRKHPEVKGLVGMAGKNSHVVKNKKQARALGLKSKKVALISQTTASISNFKDVLSEIAKKDFTELVSFNTVCKDTIQRQKEASSIAKRVDTMFVIGGKNSANTSKLAKACKKVNDNTYHIESGENLKMDYLRNKKTIGIATGASTPPRAINEIIKRIRRFDANGGK